MANKWGAAFCTKFRFICDDATKHVYHEKYDNPEADALYISMVHSGSSLKQYLHYGQDALFNNFRQYDYGTDAENMKRYGSTTVPVIDLSKISKDIPMYLYVGEEDTQADMKDVEWLLEQMGDRVKQFTKIPDFDHTAFVTGKYVGWMPDAIGHLAKHNP